MQVVDAERQQQLSLFRPLGMFHLVENQNQNHSNRSPLPPCCFDGKSLAEDQLHSHRAPPKLTLTLEQVTNPIHVVTASPKMAVG